MRNLLADLLPGLERHRLNGLDAGPQAIYPSYDGDSLANLPASICHWLGLPRHALGLPRHALGLPDARPNSADLAAGGHAQFEPPLRPEILNLLPGPYQQVIFLVADGFGLDRMQSVLGLAGERSAHPIWLELAQDAVLAPLTSITPSTTAAALTTFWTGVTPARHGVVGYEVWLKEFSLIANMIFHSPASFSADPNILRRAGFDPLTFLPVPVLGPILARHNIRSFAFQHHSIAQSGLSTMLMPGVGVIPFRSLGDLWVTLEDLLDSRAGETGYHYVYWGDLDELSHRFGPQDERVELELVSFSEQLARFVRRRRQRARQSTLFILTADHGHLSTPRRPEYELRNHPEMLDMLVMLPSGEARLPFVFLRPGREADFLAYLDQAWPGQFRAIPSAQAIRSGLFGSGAAYARLSERVGDYVILPQGDAYWWFANRDNPLLGRHGGLSRTEMLVPLFAFEL